MSFLFRTDVVFYNAFFAVQDKTSVLSYDQTMAFCALLDKELKETFAEQNLCCNAIFDLNTSDDSFFDSDENDFLRTGDSVLYYGEEINDDRLRLINSCYSADVIEILNKVHEKFRLLLEEDEPMGSLRPEVRQLTVI